MAFIGVVEDDLLIQLVKTQGCAFLGWGHGVLGIGAGGSSSCHSESWSEKWYAGPASDPEVGPYTCDGVKEHVDVGRGVVQVGAGACCGGKAQASVQRLRTVMANTDRYAP